jgi:hypothetical protein
LARFRGVQAMLAAPDANAIAAHADLDATMRTVPDGGAYLEWAKRLGPQELDVGARWLEGVRARYLEAPRRAGVL